MKIQKYVKHMLSFNPYLMVTDHEISFGPYMV